MGAVFREDAGQFRVRLAEVEGGAFRRLFGRERREVDPYLVSRAVVEVMRRCQSRAPSGQRLVWNEYRLILAPQDFEHLRTLQDYLARELRGILEAEVGRLRAELVGDLCVHVVVDEAGELAPGEAVVRVSFATSDRIAAPEDGEMTVRLGAGAVVGEILAPADAGASGGTVPVGERAAGSLVASYQVHWPGGGGATLYEGVRAVLGRPHPGHPPQFVPLRGASARVNKEHVIAIPRGACVVVGRVPGANPVRVNGRALAGGEEIELWDPRVEISLSHGDFVLALDKLGVRG